MSSPSLAIWLFASAGFLVFGALASVAQVGKPRGPLSGLVAMYAVALTGIVVAVMIAAGIRLL